MTNRPRVAGLLGTPMLSAGIANANGLTEQVVADLTAQGYGPIEIKVCPETL